MRKRDELADPTSCLNRAKDDEWLFVLLGRDPEGPDTVRDWVRRRIKNGRNKADDPKMLEALAWADRVELEQAGRCPRCGSPAPNLHPAVQYGGEVQTCSDPYHGLAEGKADG